MPFYEYQCKGCGFEFEREQRIHDKPLRKCPSCGGMKAKRLISRTSFVLKGSGWYRDGYGAGSSRESSEKSAETGQAKGDSKSGTAAGSSSGDGGRKSQAEKPSSGKPSSQTSKAA